MSLSDCRISAAAMASTSILTFGRTTLSAIIHHLYPVRKPPLEAIWLNQKRNTGGSTERHRLDFRCLGLYAAIVAFI